MLLTVIAGLSHFIVKCFIDEALCIVPQKNIINDIHVVPPNYRPVSESLQEKWSDGKSIVQHLD